MRAAFAAYAATHEPASIRRCWLTWNVLCDFLYANQNLQANQMPFVRRPKVAKALPRSLSQRAVGAARGGGLRPGAGVLHRLARTRPALILTGLLAGLRPDEIRRADVGDIHTSTDDGAVIHVRGRAARTAPCRSRPSYSRSSRTTSTAGPIVSQ
jgi:integrase/recombinase XerC